MFTVLVHLLLELPAPAVFVQLLLGEPPCYLHGIPTAAPLAQHTKKAYPDTRAAQSNSIGIWPSINRLGLAREVTS
jgi:hypothetical protein